MNEAERWFNKWLNQTIKVRTGIQQAEHQNVILPSLKSLTQHAEMAAYKGFSFPCYCTQQLDRKCAENHVQE